MVKLKQMLFSSHKHPKNDVKYHLGTMIFGRSFSSVVTDFQYI